MMVPPCIPVAAASAAGMHLEIMHRIGPAVPVTTASRPPGPGPPGNPQPQPRRGRPVPDGPLVAISLTAITKSCARSCGIAAHRTSPGAPAAGRQSRTASHAARRSARPSAISPPCCLPSVRLPIVTWINHQARKASHDWHPRCYRMRVAGEGGWRASLWVGRKRSCRSC
jgi:hypothetical protein